MTPEEKLKLDLMLNRTESAKMGIGSEEVEGKMFRGLIQSKKEPSQPTYYEKMIEPMYKASMNPKVPDIVRAQIYYENPLVQMMQKQKAAEKRKEAYETSKENETEGMGLLKDVYKGIESGEIRSPETSKMFIDLLKKMSEKT